MSESDAVTMVKCLIDAHTDMVSAAAAYCDARSAREKAIAHAGEALCVLNAARANFDRSVEMEHSGAPEDSAWSYKSSVNVMRGATPIATT